MRSKWLSLVSGIAGAVLLVSCGGSTSPYSTGGGGGGGGGGHSTTITVGNDFFSPALDTVPAGQVTFTWATPSNGHNVTWDTGAGGGAASAGRDRTGCAPVTTTSLRSAGADRALITSIIVFESRACSTITTPE